MSKTSVAATPYPYSEATAEFMDMAGQERPKLPLIPVGEANRKPSAGDVGTLQGLQNATAQCVARIKHPVLRLRMALLLEEVNELAEACIYEDMELIARNIADILYVAHSFPHSLGYDGDAVYDSVHKANMQKKMGKVRSDGKQLAPVDFKPPNIMEVLKSSANSKVS
jgi:predicted HAD superfamily Cof-like phosphohydrolase